MTIGEVARRAGLRPSAIRYYEGIGLLPRPPRISGCRLYGDEVFNRLAVIQYAKQTGFSTGEIKRLVGGFPGNTPPSARWRTMATRKIAEMDALIAKAGRIKVMLDRALRCECPTLEECGQAILSRRNPVKGAG